MLHDFLYISYLFDVYGNLLTKKQQKCLKLYLFSDLSTTEISTELAISRQAVHDMLKKSEKILMTYEEKLHFIAHEREICKEFEEIKKMASDCLLDTPSAPKMREKITSLSKRVDIILTRFNRINSLKKTKEFVDDF